MFLSILELFLKRTHVRKRTIFTVVFHFSNSPTKSRSLKIDLKSLNHFVFEHDVWSISDWTLYLIFIGKFKKKHLYCEDKLRRRWRLVKTAVHTPYLFGNFSKKYQRLKSLKIELPLKHQIFTLKNFTTCDQNYIVLYF